MAPFNLNLSGLNVVHPDVQQDTHDIAAPFPDFSAHLDLWTNLPFESDEPLALPKQTKTANVDDDDNNNNNDDDDDDDDSPSQDTLENAVVPNPSFDINALLAGVGIDPFLIPPPPPQRSAPPQFPSLAQLLALHGAHTTSLPVPSPPTATPTTDPSPPTTKRVRVQKTPSPTDSNSDPRASTSTPPSPQEPFETAVSPLSAAEDKRRRNTAASARFRLKKKEREAALERRAKELEDRVAELERECEGLRRENGWLKGLVVGVTGAGAAQQHASAK